MKTIKNKISQNDYYADSVTDKEQKKYLQQIAYWVGYFIFKFNFLEDTITNLAAQHIDGQLEEHDYAYIYLTGMQFGQKIELLERYYDFMTNMVGLDNEGALKKRIDEVIVEIKDIAKTRNTIVHANYYSLDRNGNIKEKVKYANSDIEEYWVSITKDFLLDSINRITHITNEIDDLDEEFEELIQS